MQNLWFVCVQKIYIHQLIKMSSYRLFIPVLHYVVSISEKAHPYTVLSLCLYLHFSEVFPCLLFLKKMVKENCLIQMIFVIFINNIIKCIDQEEEDWYIMKMVD